MQKWLRRSARAYLAKGLTSDGTRLWQGDRLRINEAIPEVEQAWTPGELGENSRHATRVVNVLQVPLPVAVPGGRDLRELRHAFGDVVDPREGVVHACLVGEGEHVEHGHPGSKAGGKYWVDNTSGYGPETFTLAKVPSGTFRVGAHFHSGSGRTTVRFAIVLHEDTDREQRQEHTLVLEKSGEQKFVADLAATDR